MIKVVGIRFRKAGKIYYFCPKELSVKVGDNVIVETARGIEYGHVVLGEREIDENQLPSPCKDIIRLSTHADDKQYEKNKKNEEKAFDQGKVIFYFSAESRVDFRELVKDLASVFRTRIELRQIGVRDEAKMLGGYSTCGRELCCHSVLGDFQPVSIKMAKQQNLSLNPAKISGVCGRLMCCLKYEYDEYDSQNPAKGCNKQCGACQHPCAKYLTGEEVDEAELRKLED